MSVDTGGPAFPHVAKLIDRGVGGRVYDAESAGGMTLRQWYAGLMLPGLVAVAAHDTVWHPKKIATDAFELADAMIAEDNKGEAP